MTTGTISVMIFARPGCNGRREEAMRAYVRAFPICLVVLATAALSASAGAAETLRVGKAVPFAWTFTPVEVGIETGQFGKQGLTVEPSAFGGDARLQQAIGCRRHRYRHRQRPRHGVHGQGCAGKG